MHNMPLINQRMHPSVQLQCESGAMQALPILQMLDMRPANNAAVQLPSFSALSEMNAST